MTHEEIRLKAYEMALEIEKDNGIKAVQKAADQIEKSLQEAKQRDGDARSQILIAIGLKE